MMNVFAQIIHHEAVGHGFGYLGDEYDDVYDGEIPSNVMAELKEIADRYDGILTLISLRI